MKLQKINDPDISTHIYLGGNFGGFKRVHVKRKEDV